MGPQPDVHHPLERGRSSVQAEGKGPVLPVPIGGAEGCFGFGRFGEGYLTQKLRMLLMILHR